MHQNITQINHITSLILKIRGEKAILDSDLAMIYGVTTKRLNEQVKRNKQRFPQDFAFQLTSEEYESLKSQIATSKKRRGGRRHIPFVFTEHGALMAANVLNSSKAVEMSVFVIRAFVKMRNQLIETKEMARRLSEIEKILISHNDAIKDIYEQIHPLLIPPEDKSDGKKIGFKVKENWAGYEYHCEVK